MFGEMLARAFDGASKSDILFSHDAADIESAALRAIAGGGYRDKKADDISGSGYVVHCLEAALWCFLTTDSFSAAILQAANLGQDADTTAAVCRQIAGAYYGESGIPAHWLARLAMGDEIGAIAEQLYAGPG
jgi:ADP-ribosyl-[dinitrogen reductase] hydrolase